MSWRLDLLRSQDQTGYPVLKGPDSCGPLAVQTRNSHPPCPSPSIFHSPTVAGQIMKSTNEKQLIELDIAASLLIGSICSSFAIGSSTEP